MINKNAVMSALLPPQFEDDEQNRIATILQSVALATLLGLGILVFVRVQEVHIQWLIPIGITCLLMVVVIIFLRLRMLTISTNVLLWTMLGLVELMIWMNDGFHDTAVFAIPGILVVAGLVLTRSYFLVFTLIALGSFALLGWFEVMGIIQNKYSHYTNLPDVADMAVILGLTSVTVRLLTDNLIRSAARARQKEKDGRAQADQLRLSEERYRTLFDGANDAILLMSGDRFVECNDMTITMFGCELRDDIVGHHPWEFSPDCQPDGRKSLEKASDLIRLVLDGAPQRFAWKHSRKDGTLFDVEVSLNCIRSGDETLLQAMVRDVTESKQMEERVRNSEEYYRTLVETSPDAIFIVDRNGRLTFASQTAFEIFDAPTDVNVVGTSILDWVGPAHHQLATSRLAGLLAGELKPEAREYELLRYDRTPFWGEINASPLIDAKGVMTGMMMVCRDISERKGAEESMRQSEAALRSFINALPEAAFLLDKSGKLLIVNGAFARIWSKNPKEYVGLDLYDLLPPRIAEAREAQIDNVLKTGRAVVFEDERDGRHFVNYIEPVVNAQGDVDCVAVFIMNITEHKRIEQELRQSEEEYRGLFENAHDAIVIFEPERERVLDANQRACEMYGFDRSEFLGMSLLSISKNPAKGKEIISDVLKKRAIQGFGTTHLRKDGSEMPLEVNAALVNYRGKPAIISINRDVTERTRIEEALREQEAIYREAIAQADAVPYSDVFNPLRFEFLGEGIERLCGYSSKELTPQIWRGMIEELIMRGRCEGMTREEAVNKALNGELKEWRSENKIRHRDGSIRWVSDSAIQIFDSNGNAVGSIGILQDITERKQSEQQMLQSLHEKEVLLKEIHHRVKNNLQVVSSLLNLQANHLRDDTVKVIFKESQNRIRSMALVHEYLYRSTDLANINFSDYVSKFLSEIVRSYSASIGRVRVRTHVENVTLSINEAIPCGLIINELATNAIKYAFPTRHNGELTVSMEKAASGVWELIVQDNGVGLPEEFQIESASTLGMRLVYSFVRQLKGTIDIDRNRGTRFAITFTSASENASIEE
jgi:PAS domain S-box-containing protein